MSSPEQVDALAAAALEAHGRVDVMCSNAGVLAQGPAGEIWVADCHDPGPVATARAARIVAG